MQPQEKVLKCYNDTAESYAAARLDELAKKHLDPLLLKEFASINKNKGICADFGCGPGHTTKFLYDCGLKNIIGSDLSPGMVSTAQSHFPEINFTTADLLALPFDNDYFSSAIAFYSIVHFDYDQIGVAFREVKRVLKKGAQFLFSFHVGEKTVHFDKANDIEVDIDLYFWQTDTLLELLDTNNFRIIDAIERHPYPDVEYQSRRGYVWCEKK